MDVQEAIKVMARFELAAVLTAHVGGRARPLSIPPDHWGNVVAHMDSIIQGLDTEPGDFAEAVRMLREDLPHEDAAEKARQALGIDGTAGDAQDVPHNYKPRPAGDTGACLVCDLTRTWRMHTGEDAQPAKLK